MIAVIDYGAGNIRSVTKALESVGADVTVSRDPQQIEKRSKIVLPGVGAFGKAMAALKEQDLINPIIRAVQQGKPFLGICLGLQILFESSEESPNIQGLGLLKGKVRRFSLNLKVPHLGWNQVEQVETSLLWKGIPDKSFYYFAHSYYIDPDNSSITTGKTDYGTPFSSSVMKDKLFGLQFHPEKSQKWGLKILKNFVNL